MYDKIQGAVCNDDIISVHEVLYKNPDLLKYPGCGKYASELLERALRSNCRHGILKTLIKFGVDLNFGDPLTSAINNCNEKAVELLLKNGAAIQEHHVISMVKCILGWEGKDIRKSMLTSLMKYCLRHTEFWREKGEFLCDMFEENSVVEVAEALLDWGVPVNGLDRENQSLLYHFKDEGELEMVRFLVKKGADLSKKNKFGEFLLHSVVASNDNEDIVDLILSRGFDIDAKDGYGETPLHRACARQTDKMIRLLIQNGADVTAKNKFGQSPFLKLHLQDLTYDACVRLLIEEYAKAAIEEVQIPEIDMKLIRNNKIFLDFFEDCKSKLRELASTKFYASYSYYKMLRGSTNMKKLAKLTRNEDFVKGYRRNLRKLQYYQNKLRRILREAEKIRDKSLIVQNRLESLFGGYLPDLIVRKLGSGLSVEDLPLV